MRHYAIGMTDQKGSEAVWNGRSDWGWRSVIDRLPDLKRIGIKNLIKIKFRKFKIPFSIECCCSCCDYQSPYQHLIISIKSQTGGRGKKRGEEEQMRVKKTGRERRREGV